MPRDPLQTSLPPDARTAAAGTGETLNELRQLHLLTLAEPALGAAIGTIFEQHPEAPVTFDVRDGVVDKIMLVNDPEARSLALELQGPGEWHLTRDAAGEEQGEWSGRGNQMSQALLRAFSEDEKTRLDLLTAYDAAPHDNQPGNPGRFIEADPAKRGFDLVVREICEADWKTPESTEMADRIVAQAVTDPEYLAQFAANRWASGVVDHASPSPARLSVQLVLEEAGSVDYVDSKIAAREAEFGRNRRAAASR